MVSGELVFGDSQAAGQLEHAESTSRELLFGVFYRTELLIKPTNLSD